MLKILSFYGVPHRIGGVALKYKSVLEVFLAVFAKYKEAEPDKDKDPFTSPRSRPMSGVYFSPIKKTP